ncbi:DUF6458 family protein [Kribbella sp. CA-294648]|uniref:DUF6458 family protein n=1 Tax=Kribbella sp. CA-294648 TaxID=3239948 RepID=UPI003D92FC21
MRIHGGIALTVVGALVAFAIRDTSSRIDLTAIGIIIMLGGGLWLWFSYQLVRDKDEEEIELIKPKVEEQYTTEPHEYAIEEQIDVTPSHIKPPQEP